MTFEDFLVEPGHIFRSEGGFERYHFIGDAAERPDIGFDVVGLIAPDLGARVVRSSGLGVE